MKKIPTLFVRDPENMKRLLREVHPDCQWVLDGEGVAKRKYDGTCCLIRARGENDIDLLKRREIRSGKPDPEGFELVDEDRITGKRVGWVPVGGGPDDRWYREAIEFVVNRHWMFPQPGTYELIGPKVQGNPEGVDRHLLVSHAAADAYDDAPRDFDGLREFLKDFPHEGIVWHHEDGRMAKIKRKDFW